MTKHLVLALALSLPLACSKPTAAAESIPEPQETRILPLDGEPLEILPLEVEHFPIAERATWEAELPAAVLDELDRRAAVLFSQSPELFWSRDAELLRLRVNAASPDSTCFVLPTPSGQCGNLGSAFLFVYDAQAGTLSPEPLVLDLKYLRSDLLGTGVIGMDPRAVDLDGDGQLELDLRHFEHNGTVTNINYRVIIDVTPHASPREVLRFADYAAEVPLKRKWGDVTGELLRLADGDLMLRETWYARKSDKVEVLSRARLTRGLEPRAAWTETQRVDEFPELAFTFSWPKEEE